MTNGGPGALPGLRPAAAPAPLEAPKPGGQELRGAGALPEQFASCWGPREDERLRPVCEVKRPGRRPELVQTIRLLVIGYCEAEKALDLRHRELLASVAPDDVVTVRSEWFLLLTGSDTGATS